jgi:hypothetical protein
MDFPDFGYSFGRASLDPRRPEPNVAPRPLTSDPLYICGKLAVVAMQPDRLVRHLGRGRSLLVRKSRSVARQVLRATLPPFRRLDERAAADAQAIVGLAAEIAGLRDHIRSLEGENRALSQRCRSVGATSVEQPLAMKE